MMMRQILSQQIDQQYERSKYPENNAWFFLKTFKKSYYTLRAMV